MRCSDLSSNSSEESEHDEYPKHLNSDQLDALEDTGEQSKIWQEGLERILEVASTLNHRRKNEISLSRGSGPNTKSSSKGGKHHPRR